MKLSERQQKILEIIKETSPISGDEIAEKIGLTKSALRTDFSILTKLSLISSKTKKGYSYKKECTANKVKDVMSPQNSIDAKTSVYDAIIHLFSHDLGTLLVTDRDNLVGIISRKDLLKSVLNGKNIEKIPVNMIMTRMPNLVCCYEEDDILEVIKKLIAHEIDAIPVIRRENNKIKVVGRFTKTNVTKLYYKELIKKQLF
ncbi:MAG: helix-turn-helix transcriptional regulator [Fusobacterium sp.]|uniref:helix-turn-helix transcriptional regulator n=1 Tax=Fusobacterium sp. TaxID=68766 RepID=UPI0026DADB87|nr:helix-turn-helix transcriptional regulator [Fusobacterium sp.]MDO4690310.1 helix-turn-helix transcriptional regulator [Fusobacterium sp.]